MRRSDALRSGAARWFIRSILFYGVRHISAGPAFSAWPGIWCSRSAPGAPGTPRRTSGSTAGGSAGTWCSCRSQSIASGSHGRHPSAGRDHAANTRPTPWSCGEPSNRAHNWAMGFRTDSLCFADFTVGSGAPCPKDRLGASFGPCPCSRSDTSGRPRP